MGDITTVKKIIESFFPGISMTLDLAQTESGSSWLDINIEDKLIVIEYRPSSGYGLHLQQDRSFGTKPDETYKNVQTLIRRIAELLPEDDLTVSSYSSDELAAWPDEKLKTNIKAAEAEYECHIGSNSHSEYESSVFLAGLLREESRRTEINPPPASDNEKTQP